MKKCKERDDLNKELFSLHAKFRGNIQKPEPAGFANETVSYFQPLQMANDSPIKKQFYGMIKSRVGL